MLSSSNAKVLGITALVLGGVGFIIKIIANLLGTFSISWVVLLISLVFLVIGYYLIFVFLDKS